jgi:predicted MFS family arabinose efflux permease
LIAEAERGETALYRALRLVVLLSGGILGAMVQLAIVPALPGMAEYFTAGGRDGTFAAQNVTTIAAPAMGLGAPLVGWLAGRLGKRRILLVSALVYALAGGAGAFASDLWTLLASRLVLGIAAAGYLTVSVSLIGDYYPVAVRDRLISWYAVIGAGGTLVILKAAGLLTGLSGWRAPFGLYLVGLPLFLLGMFTIGEVRRERVEAADRAPGVSIIGAWGIYVLITLLSISLFTLTIQGPFLMTKEGIADPVVQANILLLYMIGSVVGAYVFRFIGPALGFHLVLAVTWGMLALGNIGFASTLNVYLLAAFAAAVGVGGGLMQPLTQTAILNMVASVASARAIGIAIGCIFLGQFLHPLVLAPLRIIFGLHAAFLWMGGASLIAALLALLQRLKENRSTAPHAVQLSQPGARSG